MWVCARMRMHKLTDRHTHTHHGCMLMGMIHREGENDDSGEGSAGATIWKDQRIGSRAQIERLAMASSRTPHCKGGKTQTTGRCSCLLTNIYIYIYLQNICYKLGNGSVAERQKSLSS